jgi:superfamily II DNA or RNA helicase
VQSQEGSKKYMSDRSHQVELRTKLREFHEERPLKILAHVVPGGGKSHLPGIIAEEFPNYKIAWFVPRDALRKQAIAHLEKWFQIKLRDSGNDIDPSRGLRGFVTTMQALSKSPDVWIHALKQDRYVVCCDELHHLKLSSGTRESNEYARSMACLKKWTDVWLNMTGTLKTNDNSFIYDIAYRDTKRGAVAAAEQSVSHPNLAIRYTRQQALSEKVIVPVISITMTVR